MAVGSTTLCSAMLQTSLMRSGQHDVKGRTASASAQCRRCSATNRAKSDTEATASAMQQTSLVCGRIHHK